MYNVAWQKRWNAYSSAYVWLLRQNSNLLLMTPKLWVFKARTWNIWVLALIQTVYQKSNSLEWWRPDRIFASSSFFKILWIKLVGLSRFKSQSCYNGSLLAKYLLNDLKNRIPFKIIAPSNIVHCSKMHRKSF